LQKISGPEEVFLSPEFWASAESLYADYGGFYWLREKSTRIERVGGNWMTHKDYHMQVVILDASIMEEYADASVAFGGSSKVSDLRARTITSEGAVFPVKKDDIFERSAIPGFMLYSERRAKVFAMPGFCDRCVLDIRYRRTDEGPCLYDEFHFGTTIPVRHARYSYSTNPVIFTAGLDVFCRSYNFMATPQVRKFDTPNGTVDEWTWELGHIQAFAGEAWMAPRETYVPRVLLATGKKGEAEPDWAKFANLYWDIWQDTDRRDPAVAALASEITAGAASDAEKIARVAGRIGSDIRYVAVDLDESAWQPHAPSVILENKYGDCKDMANLAVDLLDLAGIKAYPALVLTNTNGKIDMELLAPRFDHMIVFVESPEGEYWLDPTVAPCPLGYLPPGDRDVDALVIKEGKALWKRTPAQSPVPAVRRSSTMATLSPDGTVMANSRITYEGDWAVPIFHDLKGSTKADAEEKIANMLRSLIPGMKLDRCGLDDMCASTGVVRISASYTFPSAATRVSDRIAIRLNFLRPQGCRLADIGSASKRRFPVWLPYGWTEQDTIHLEVPTGWQIGRLPQAARREGAYGSYAFDYKASGNWLTAANRCVVKAGTVPVSGLTAFREVWSNLESIMAEDIILKEI
jgi:hypothetical protein